MDPLFRSVYYIFIEQTGVPRLNSLTFMPGFWKFLPSSTLLAGCMIGFSSPPVTESVWWFLRWLRLIWSHLVSETIDLVSSDCVMTCLVSSDVWDCVITYLVSSGVWDWSGLVWFLRCDDWSHLLRLCNGLLRCLRLFDDWSGTARATVSPLLSGHNNYLVWTFCIILGIAATSFIWEAIALAPLRRLSAGRGVDVPLGSW